MNMNRYTAVLFTISLIVVISFTACQSDKQPSAVDGMDADMLLALFVQLSDIDRSTKADAPILTPAQTLADGEIMATDLTNCSMNEKSAKATFVCPALSGKEVSIIRGDLVAGSTGFLTATEIPESFTPRLMDIEPGITKAAWLHVAKGNKGAVLAQAERNKSNYNFTLKQSNAKLSIVLQDKQGNAITCSKEASNGEPASSISAVLKTTYTIEQKIAFQLNTGKWVDTTTKPGSIIDMQSVPYYKNDVACSIPLDRAAAIAGGTENIMPNLFNQLLAPQTLSGTGTAWSKDDNGTPADESDDFYIPDSKKYPDVTAKLTITIPSAINGTDKDLSYSILCEKILLDSDKPYADTRTALTELKAGEHAIITITIDQLKPIAASASIGSWYSVEISDDLGNPDSSNPLDPLPGGNGGSIGDWFFEESDGGSIGKPSTDESKTNNN